MSDLAPYEIRRQFMCASCGALPGERCRTKRGGYSNEHASRWEQEAAEWRRNHQVLAGKW